jgi:hypothetical protein
MGQYQLSRFPTPSQEPVQVSFACRLVPILLCNAVDSEGLVVQMWPNFFLMVVTAGPWAQATIPRPGEAPL